MEKKLPEPLWKIIWRFWKWQINYFMILKCHYCVYIQRQSRTGSLSVYAFTCPFQHHLHSQDVETNFEVSINRWMDKEAASPRTEEYYSVTNKKKFWYLQLLDKPSRDFAKWDKSDIRQILYDIHMCILKKLYS